MKRTALTNGILLVSIGAIHNVLGMAAALGVPGLTPAWLGHRGLAWRMGRRRAPAPAAAGV
jgi:hypothetical protein